MSRRWLAAVLFSFSVLAPWSSYALSANELAPQKVAQMQRLRRVQVVDVREKVERRDGVVKNSIWFAGSDVTNGNLKWQEFVNAHKKQTLIFYCSSGQRAKRIHEAALVAGLKSYYFGFDTWKSAKMPLQIPPEE